MFVSRRLTRNKYKNLKVTGSLNKWNLVAVTFGMDINNPKLMNHTLVDAQKAVIDVLCEKKNNTSWRCLITMSASQYGVIGPMKLPLFSAFSGETVAKGSGDAGGVIDIDDGFCLHLRGIFIV